MREVIIDGTRYIPDPRRREIKLYLVTSRFGDRQADVYTVQQNLEQLPDREQFLIERDDYGNLTIRPLLL